MCHPWNNWLVRSLFIFLTLQLIFIVGFGVGISEIMVPNYEHESLYKTIVKDGGCGYKNFTQCIVLIDGIIAAFRTRTTTSAGMKDVILKEQKELVSEKFNLTGHIWRYLQKHFTVETVAGYQMNQYLQRNMAGVLMDNLKGQCTDGHSCKLSSKENLQKLIEIKEESTKGYLIAKNNQTNII